MSDWFFQAMEATWPPAETREAGPFLLRQGAGGGKRVSAATAEAAWDQDALTAAEAAMAEPLFLIRPRDVGLDAALAGRGYAVVDPVLAYAAPVGALTGELPFLAGLAHWPPLAVAREVWAEGGIGPGRVAVMERVTGPRTAVLARQNDRPAGVAFVACAGEEAMIHAVEVRPAMRRQGVGAQLLCAAANWAADQGATRLSLAVTERNTAARALYGRAGMSVVGQYHYRAK